MISNVFVWRKRRRLLAPIWKADIEPKTKVPVCSDFHFLRKRLSFQLGAGVIVTTAPAPLFDNVKVSNKLFDDMKLVNAKDKIMFCSVPQKFSHIRFVSPSQKCTLKIRFQIELVKKPTAHFTGWSRLHFSCLDKLCSAKPKSAGFGQIWPILSDLHQFSKSFAGGDEKRPCDAKNSWTNGKLSNVFPIKKFCNVLIEIASFGGKMDKYF